MDNGATDRGRYERTCGRDDFVQSHTAESERWHLATIEFLWQFEWILETGNGVTLKGLKPSRLTLTVIDVCAFTGGTADFRPQKRPNSTQAQTPPCSMNRRSRPLIYCVAL